MRSLFLLGAVLTAPALLAQPPTWTRVGLSSPGPSARHSGAMAFDAARHEVVLFGGRTLSNDFNDTWVWNGSAWTQRFPAVSPPPRHSFGMAYDPVNREVVLYGGYDPSEGTSYRDTWTWDGVNWTVRPSSLQPNWNTPVGLSWDPVDQQVVLYAGVAELAVWKNHDWTLAGSYSYAPSWRRGAASAWDPVTNRLLVFGGNVTLNDSWLWQPPPANSWTNPTQPSPPEGRYVHSMVQDPSSGQVLLFGGHNYTLPPPLYLFEDTWLWNGAAWARQFPATSPDRRWKTMMAADQERRQVVLFGGEQAGILFADTWVWPSVGAPDPAISLSASPSLVTTGAETTFTMVLSNGGTAPASAVTGTMNAPAGLTGVGPSCMGSTCTTTVPSLAAGASASAGHRASLSCALAGGLSLSATANVTAASDSNPANNNAVAGIVTVNPPPSVSAPAGISVGTGSAATGCGAVVASLGSPAVSDNCPGATIATYGVPAGNFFPVGSTPVTYAATDSGGATASAIQTVTVADTTPPRAGAISVDKPVLWPANHKMVLVTLAYGVSDNCAATAACQLTEASSEPINGTGDGNTSADYQVVDARHVYLRAERAGGGNGRIYTLTVRCTDPAGNTAARTATVTVPKSQGN